MLCFFGGEMGEQFGKISVSQTNGANFGIGISQQQYRRFLLPPLNSDRLCAG